MKSRISSGRGTSTIEVDVGPANWAGKFFLGYQGAKMSSLSPLLQISKGKGTSYTAAKEYPKSKKVIDLGGRRIVTGRGTSSRIL